MLQKLREKMKSTQRGAIMVFFALLVPLFLGMIGFAIDAGFLYMQKAKLQDIADAAALAGAGHLNDANDPSHAGVTSAVSAFAEANGYKGTGTGNNYVYDKNYTSDDAVTLGKNDQWKLAQKVEPQVMDKDNKQRDHVRVLMVKRVPTFFIRFLFPEQKSVVVRALAVAEYVAGETPVISGGDVQVMASRINQRYKSADNIVLGSNKKFPVYMANDHLDPYKLPGTGIIYGSQLDNTGRTYDRTKKEIVWNPPLPEGRDFVYTLSRQFFVSEPEAEAISDAEWAEAQRVNTIYNNKREQYNKQVNDFLANRQKYIDGEDGKRYIGYDSNGNIINTIKPGDDDIELYMDGTDAQIDNNGNVVVLTNSQLPESVTSIKTLIFGKHRRYNEEASWKSNVISTDGIKYGNIYSVFGAGEISLSGKNNHFNGVVYSPYSLIVGGENNHFNEMNVTELFAEQLELGYWHRVKESGTRIEIDYWRLDESNNPSWHMYWGSGTGSSSSGSSGSDTASKSRVRLVI